MTGDDSFARYLAAKRTVDDRALDRRVWDVLAAELERRGGALDVLEAGAGSGAMVERLVGGGLVRRGCYTAVDADAGVLAEARRRLPAWASDQEIDAVNRGGGLEMRTTGGVVAVELVGADLSELLPRPGRSDSVTGRRYDLLVAHAILDLLDLETFLPRLLAALTPGGLCYFPITFDGGTFFQPPLELDAQIIALYHESMDRRKVGGRPGGSSRSGRRLLAALPTAGVEILAAAASDWIVLPAPDGSGGYPGDEAFFLRYLLATIEDALDGHPGLDPHAFAAWLRRRRRQVDRGELILIVHQLDVLGRTAVSASPPRRDGAPVRRPS